MKNKYFIIAIVVLLLLVGTTVIAGKGGNSGGTHKYVSYDADNQLLTFVELESDQSFTLATGPYPDQAFITYKGFDYDVSPVQLNKQRGSNRWHILYFDGRIEDLAKPNEKFTLIEQ